DPAAVRAGRDGDQRALAARLQPAQEPHPAGADLLAGARSARAGARGRLREPVKLTLDIGPVAHGGHCVARAPDGRVVFVRHALPGERVVAEVTEERRGYLRADAVSILVAAPGRVPPPCPSAAPGPRSEPRL